MNWQASALLLLALAATDACADSNSLAIAPAFEGAGLFHEGAVPAKQSGLWGLIDRHGAWLAEPIYESVGAGGDGRFPFKKDGLWGYLDALGNVALEPDYDEALPFDGGVAAVRRNDKWGFITQQGVLETPFQFQEIGGREGPYVSASDSSGWAVFDLRLSEGYEKRRAVTLPDSDPQEDAKRLYSISEGAIVAQFDEGEYLADLDNLGGYYEGPSARTSLFFSIRRRSEGMAAVAASVGHWGYLAKDGQLHWAGKFQDALAFSMGLAPIKSGGKWGLIDHAGRFVLAPTYDAIYPFQQGYAVARRGALRGYLKLDRGKVTVFAEPQYDDAFRFSEGLAPVSVKGVWGYLSDGTVPSGDTRDVVELRPEGEIADVTPQ
jgi:hypothetical protein